jgi:hypothetical protein
LQIEGDRIGIQHAKEISEEKKEMNVEGCRWDMKVA